MNANWLWSALLLLSGCYATPLRIARDTHILGWYHVRGGADAKVAMAYKARFTGVPLEDELAACGALKPYDFSKSKTVYVLVHGIGGDGIEFEQGIATLLDGTDTQAFLYRWVPWAARSDESKWLAQGVTHLLKCRPELRGRLVVVAHSAGGVLTSDAASLVKIDPPWEQRAVTMITVASPLAGTNTKSGNRDGREEANVMFDVGTKLPAYPPAANGVKVLHLRTSFPSDPVMKPVDGHRPNDPKVGVTGAPQLTLPEQLDHCGALQYVFEHFRAGDVSEWLKD